MRVVHISLSLSCFVGLRVSLSKAGVISSSSVPFSVRVAPSEKWRVHCFSSGSQRRIVFKSQLKMSTLQSVEIVLRVASCCCFLGHGWIAARNLEWSGWIKFVKAAGFTESEAVWLFPLIGWMDIVLAFLTLVSPTELTTAWMVVWGLCTALIRPVAAGKKRALDLVGDNAMWGFVERASNFGY